MQAPAHSSKRYMQNCLRVAARNTTLGLQLWSSHVRMLSNLLCCASVMYKNSWGKCADMKVSVVLKAALGKLWCGMSTVTDRVRKDILIPSFKTDGMIH